MQVDSDQVSQYGVVAVEPTGDRRRRDGDRPGGEARPCRRAEQLDRDRALCAATRPSSRCCAHRAGTRRRDPAHRRAQDAGPDAGPRGRRRARGRSSTAGASTPATLATTCARSSSSPASGRTSRPTSCPGSANTWTTWHDIRHGSGRDAPRRGARRDPPAAARPAGAWRRPRAACSPSPPPRRRAAPVRQLLHGRVCGTRVRRRGGQRRTPGTLPVADADPGGRQPRPDRRARRPARDHDRRAAAAAAPTRSCRSNGPAAVRQPVQFHQPGSRRVMRYRRPRATMSPRATRSAASAAPGSARRRSGCWPASGARGRRWCAPRRGSRSSAPATN